MAAAEGAGEGALPFLLKHSLHPASHTLVGGEKQGNSSELLIFVWAQVHSFSGFGLGVCTASGVGPRWGCGFPGFQWGEGSLGHSEWFTLTETGSQTHLYLGSQQPQSLVRPGRLGTRVHASTEAGPSSEGAVHCFLGMDAALTGCLQLRGPNKLAVPGLTAVTILETGQGPGQ